MLRLIRQFLSLGVIIGGLPNNIANGQAVDATPVMADFNWIVSQVNANAAPVSLVGQVGTLQTQVNGLGQRSSFTPTVAFGGASVGITYTVQAGYQFPLGNLMLVMGAVQVSNKGSSVGAMTIGGLPTSFAVTWTGILNNGYPMTLNLGQFTIPGNAGPIYPVGAVVPGTGNMQVLGQASGGVVASAFSQLDVGAAFAVQFFGLYPVA